MDLKEKVAASLKDAFPGSDVTLETGTGGRVFGSLVAPQFAEVPDDQARQRLLWSELAKRLSNDERLRVTAILALSPDEDELLAEVPPDTD